MFLRLCIFSLLLWMGCTAQVQPGDTRKEFWSDGGIQHYITKSLEDIRDHYVESTREIMVKFNNKAIPLYRRILNFFNESTQTILSAYKHVISDSFGFYSRMTVECQDLEAVYREKSYKVHHLLLQCVAKATREYLIIAQRASENIRTESRNFISQLSDSLEDCRQGVEEIDVPRCLSDRLENGVNPLERLSEFAQEEMAWATAKAALVSNDMYVCFGKQTLKVGEEASNLLEHSRKCAAEFIQLLSSDPREDLHTPPPSQIESNQILSSLSESFFREHGGQITQDDISPTKLKPEEMSSAEGDL
ncbi:uncharacterized protein [Anabrus simplex]|uniref:uncharacterized protein n=1 Tax=Anabrus simplex TaxID=316456 RepID=UPI0035A320BA